MLESFDFLFFVLFCFFFGICSDVPVFFFGVCSDVPAFKVSVFESNFEFWSELILEVDVHSPYWYLLVTDQGVDWKIIQ